MSVYNYKTVSAAAKKEKARKTMEKLKKTIPDIEPVVIEYDHVFDLFRV